jgi:hypothetical protein
MNAPRMRRHDGRLPPAFSLLRSQFADFLYARIDAEDGPPLTVLSAFTRQGIDPWQEAARLQQLPPEAARRHLAATIAALPEKARSTDEASTIAGRLIAFLPRLAAATRGFRTRLSRPFGR